MSLVGFACSEEKHHIIKRVKVKMKSDNESKVEIKSQSESEKCQ